MGTAIDSPCESDRSQPEFSHLWTTSMGLACGNQETQGMMVSTHLASYNLAVWQRREWGLCNRMPESVLNVTVRSALVFWIWTLELRKQTILGSVNFHGSLNSLQSERKGKTLALCILFVQPTKSFQYPCPFLLFAKSISFQFWLITKSTFLYVSGGGGVGGVALANRNHLRKEAKLLFPFHFYFTLKPPNLEIHFSFSFQKQVMMAAVWCC